MRTLIHLSVVVALLALSYWLFKPTPDSGDRFSHSLPWQIDRDSDGRTRVFGLTLAQSTLADAVMRIGEDHQLAIVIDSDDNAGLELYSSHFLAGPLKGKLLISAYANDEELEAMRHNASDARYMASGARQFFLNPEDLARAKQLPIKSIGFIPAINLDQEIIEARFGKPSAIVNSSDDSKHYLYPELGLDITLNREGKELLQYVAPRDFDLLRKPLATLSAKSTGAAGTATESTSP